MENLKNKGKWKNGKLKKDKNEKGGKIKSQIQCFLKEKHMFFLERDNWKCKKMKNNQIEKRKKEWNEK